MPKKPKWKENPASIKLPRLKSDPQENEKTTIAWKFGIIDLEGDFGWHKTDKMNLLNNILIKAKNFETMTWHEILQNSNNHYINVNDICGKAINRLKELKMEDIDHLVSLRLSGKERIYGIRDGIILKILWWDPEHQVCPSPKKHT